MRFEIITGVPSRSQVDIADGLNTAIQVQEASLLNLDGKFNWIKELLKDTPYADKLSYMQNEDGEFDVREIVAFLTLFNVEHPELKGRTPKEAYTSKAACLRLYMQDEKSYRMLEPILKDILYLHDYIHLNLGKIYNKETGGKAHLMSGVFDRRARGEFNFVFADEKSEFKLFDGTFFPIFGAMRYLVQKRGNSYSWKVKSFEEVKRVFDSVAPELLKITYNVSLTYGRKPNSVGKDENHWGYLYQTVKANYSESLLEQANRAGHKLE